MVIIHYKSEQMNERINLLMYLLCLRNFFVADFALFLFKIDFFLLFSFIIFKILYFVILSSKNLMYFQLNLIYFMIYYSKNITQMPTS